MKCFSFSCPSGYTEWMGAAAKTRIRAIEHSPLRSLQPRPRRSPRSASRKVARLRRTRVCRSCLPGQYRDSETGLSYNWHRYYDSTTGRYLQPDPVADLGRSRFAYARQNPLRLIDPAGLYIASANPGILEVYNRLAQTPEGAKLVEQISADPKPTHLSDAYPGKRSEGGKTHKSDDGGTTVSIDQYDLGETEMLSLLAHELQHSLDYNVHGLDIDYSPDREESQRRARGTEGRVWDSCK